MIETYNTEIVLASEADTQNLAQDLSLFARPGLAILLVGDLGSGKSTLARAFIQALSAPQTEIDVPSPSYTLVQTYDETRVPAFHADLYRLNSASEVDELGLGELLSTHVGLIEWADKLPDDFCADSLRISLSGTGNRRTARLNAAGLWAYALRRNDVIARFMNGSFAANSKRRFFEGDASSRRYEVLAGRQTGNPILMDMPTRPDGPPVKNGKPYSAIAHLAEGLPAVVAINNHLIASGYSAPRIFKADLANGLALIENLGDRVYGRMMQEGRDMSEPLGAAVAVLASMAARTWPETVAAGEGQFHAVPHYDDEALLIEANLLVSWFWPHIRKSSPSTAQVAEFDSIWKTVLPLARQTSPQWVLRDYHSPNLIWLPEREGIRRVGIIDSQDAVLGHGAYDLASMTQDARVDIAPDTAEALVAQYLALRSHEAGFDASDFRAAYAVLGAQRATKILGIFARLSRRDGKHGYLAHLPRVSRYLARNLEHPALADLKSWYVKNLPEAPAIAP